jgi:hypothetical protein
MKIINKLNMLRRIAVNSKPDCPLGLAGSSPPALIKPLALLLLVAGCAAPAPPVITSFGDFTPPAQPHYLACPQNYCLTKPDEVTALLPVPADKMRAIVRGTVETRPQAQIVSSGDEGLRLVYRQASPGGSSVVTIEIVDAEDGASGLAVYSQSEAGDRTADYDTVRRLIDAIGKAAEHKAG